MRPFPRSVCGRAVFTAAAILISAAAASAQTPTPTTMQSEAAAKPASADDATRPATTTFFGDTGLWYVPTAEVLGHKKWSTGLYRRGTNFSQGYTNVGDFAGTFAVGIKNRAELFGSFLAVTRVDRDTLPLFFNDVKTGGIVSRYPDVTQKWSGNKRGDLYVGAKISLLSEAHQKPMAVAVRIMAKLPTAKLETGAGTGKLDTSFDLIASKEVARVVELSGFGGYEIRGTPDGFDLPKGALRWGVGAGFPTRFGLRAFTELNGFLPSSDVSTITSAALIGTDQTRPPANSATENLTRLTFGLTYQARSGFFLGGGLSRNMPAEKRDSARSDEGKFTDYTDWQFRIGFHPGVRTYVTPVPMAPPPPPLPPPAPPAPRHTLTVKASCDPCTIPVNTVSTVTAVATDSISCPVTYRWNAPAGAFTTATVRVTPWRAPGQAGAVPITVTATCPSDGLTASDTITIQVTAPPAVRTYAFEDVYFDFDKTTLRPDALRILDEAVTAMNAEPTLSITIEGNTCSIGTAEYNLALGERRASAVRDYFVSRGVAASRMKTVSYGEERPKFDNEREETRRLNRRAALVVNLQRQP